MFVMQIQTGLWKNLLNMLLKIFSKVEGNILCGVSGGIDSTVAALLIHKAIGNRLKCVFR